MIIIIYWSVKLFFPELLNIIYLHKISWKWFPLWSCSFSLLEDFLVKHILFVCLFSFCFWLHCVAYEVLVSQPGISQVPTAVGKQSLNRWTTRKASKTHTYWKLTLMLCGPTPVLQTVFGGGYYYPLTCLQVKWSTERLEICPRSNG